MTEVKAHPAVDKANENRAMFSEDFLAWLPENIHVWSAFEREAIEIWGRGIKHYSSRTIVHVMRHHSAIRERGGEWKINNNHSPYLARLFDLMHPDKVGMWEYRGTPKVDREGVRKEAA